MRSPSLVLTLFLSVSASASAQPVSWMFTGNTASTTSPDAAFAAQFPVGLPVSMLMTYNQSAAENAFPPAFLGNPAIGFYVLSNNNAAGVQFVDVETRIGSGRWHLGGWPEQIYVRATEARIHNDGVLTEVLKGDLISATSQWKPHYRTWSMQWPGFAFASDALPSAFPHPFPAGAATLHFRTCANNIGDPCPGGVQLRSRIHVALSSVRPVFTQRIVVTPGGPLNRIDRSLRATPVAILGNHAFQPAVQVDRTTIELSKAPVHTSQNQPACSASDVNGDGYVDLLCQMRTERIVPREHESNVVRLTAKTTDGNYIQSRVTVQFVN